MLPEARGIVLLGASKGEVKTRTWRID